MGELNNKQIIEALIMASEEPLTIERLHKIFISNNNILEISQLRDLIKELCDDYSGCGVELKEVASGWRFQIKHDLSDWIAKLHEERPPRYSHALLETLSLVAYRQPITRAEIENVRGVAVSSHIVRTLLNHEWVKVVGHKETPGRPALFATTKNFLDHFNLKTLDELPPLMEFTETIQAEADEEESLSSSEERLSSSEEHLSSSGLTRGSDESVIQLVEADQTDEIEEEVSEDLFDPYEEDRV